MRRPKCCSRIAGKSIISIIFWQSSSMRFSGKPKRYIERLICVLMLETVISVSFSLLSAPIFCFTYWRKLRNSGLNKESLLTWGWIGFAPSALSVLFVLIMAPIGYPVTMPCAAMDGSWYANIFCIIGFYIFIAKAYERLLMLGRNLNHCGSASSLGISMTAVGCSKVGSCSTLAFLDKNSEAL